MLYILNKKALGLMVSDKFFFAFWKVIPFPVIYLFNKSEPFEQVWLGTAHESFMGGLVKST